MVRYAHLLRNFPQFVVIRSQSFHVVSEADVFLELPCFLHDPVDVGNLISDSSLFETQLVHLDVFSS